MKLLNTKSVKNYGLLYSGFFIYSFVNVFAKKASAHPLFSKEFIIWVSVEVFFLAIYAVMWQQVLKRFDLITAMSSKGSVIVISLLWAIIIFGETITLFNIIGTVVIIFGIWMVSSEGQRSSDD